MPHDRFLSRRSRTQAGAALGRDFNVIEQIWRLSDDPKVVPPREVAVTTRRTASEAADVARNAAQALASNGFHKPSGAWWGADGAVDDADGDLLVAPHGG